MINLINSFIGGILLLSCASNAWMSPIQSHHMMRQRVPFAIENDRPRKLELTIDSHRFTMTSTSMGEEDRMVAKRITVMGGGNFGLAMATLCCRRGLNTTLLVRNQDVADEINKEHTHPTYQKGITFDSSLLATSDPSSCIPHSDYLIHAVPCQYSRSFLEKVAPYISPNTPILSISKGIEIKSLGFMENVIRSTVSEDQPLAFLSGPSFAREIIEGVATGVVIASSDLDLASDLALLLSDDRFRCFTSQDVIGVEVGGAVKNVIAVGAGMCEGLGLGTNALAGLVTRACNEMRRLGVSLGAKPSTMAGLSGVGDTFGTCFGPLSRNRKFGFRMGQGETAEEIRKSTKEVAEGVDTAKALIRLIETTCRGYRLDLKYPILFGIERILDGKQTPLEGLEALMTMPVHMENFDERSYYAPTFEGNQKSTDIQRKQIKSKDLRTDTSPSINQEALRHRHGTTIIYEEPLAIIDNMAKDLESNAIKAVV